MCFHESPLVLLYPLVMRMLYFSQFFTPLCWICLWAKVCDVVFIICSLLVGIYYVTDKLKVEWKLHFLEWKTNSFFLGKHAPRSPHPRERGLTAPCWYSWLLYSHLLQFLLKPLGVTLKPLGVTLQQNTDFRGLSDSTPKSWKIWI